MTSLPLFFETRAHVLVCTGPSCRRAGSQQLFDGAWQDLEQHGLAYYKRGGSLRITESGCLGACSSGPNVACYHADRDGKLAQAWYCGMTRTSLLAVARALHAGDPLPSEGRFDR